LQTLNVIAALMGIISAMLKLLKVGADDGEKKENGRKSVKLMDNSNERITPVEARRIIEAVTTLAKSMAFTRLEVMKIAKVCQDCCNRLEREGEVDG